MKHQSKLRKTKLELKIHLIITVQTCLYSINVQMDEWSASRTGRALLPGKGPPVPIVQEAGLAPEPVWT
jgi:hypothetical protein